MRLFVVLIATFVIISPCVAADEVNYVTQIKPILAARCYACHSALRRKSGLRLDTAAELISGGDAGPAIVPGKANESYLISMLTGESGTRMPPENEGAALSADQVTLFRKWIDQGAHSPVETPLPDPREHWSYQCPKKASLPNVKNAGWVRNPVDAFVAAAQESRHLSASPPADREILLRRVYLDLIGLPPTRDELDTYLADETPNAYESVVDRLLASPQYGERWARHWMDIWRYSDWAGYRDEIRNSARHIWRWRDWIVESLNEDKGYDRMVTEMLAGDELAPTDPNVLRATGFLVRNWEKFSRTAWLEETVEHTAKAFLGVTMNCCRCHDHKFDPISQAEYFQFRAIFEPHDIRTERIPNQPDVLKDGLVRACDLRLEAPTYVLERGDEKRPQKDQAVKPGVPEVLGSSLKIKPIDLPVATYYPALKEFALKEDQSQAQQKVSEADTALAKSQAAIVTARKKNDEKSLLSFDAAAEAASKHVSTMRAAQTALAARIAAEKAKYGLTANVDANQLALAAGKAERELALCQAQEQRCVAEQEFAVAKAAQKPGDVASANAVAAAEKKVMDASMGLTAAHAALAEPNASYAPLGKQLPHQSTGRRLAFARCLANRDNPLTARVAINHIWLRHFGAPLVDNVFDFGLRSPRSNNQPLLDWLAVELMDHNWQMKHIHRLLVTSNTYRMVSMPLDTNSPNIAGDPDNRYLWRMNTRRLEAELVRDSIFYVAGNLDLTRGGPDLACTLGATAPRRSIYFQHAYEKQNKFLELFDAASVNECYRRSESIVPQQALALANSETTLNESRLLALKLSDSAAKIAGADSNALFVRLAYKQILCRDPSKSELSECKDFLERQAHLLQDPAKLTSTNGGPTATVAASTDPKQRARENLTLVLYNHNDFVTIH